MIHPNDKFRFISKERLLFISHNKQREVIGSSASVEELMFSCGEAKYTHLPYSMYEYIQNFKK